MRIFFLLVVFGLSISRLNAQCIRTMPYPNATIPISNTGSITTIATDQYTSERSTLGSAIIGNVYEFRITQFGTHKYVTITNTINVVLAHGMSPFSWTSTISGEIRVHWSENAACGSTNIDHTTTVQCTSCTTSPAPGNDDCSGAVAFGVVPTDGSCMTLNSQYTSGATQSQVACIGTGSDDDIWFSFVATGNSVTTVITNVSGNTDMVHEIFSGSCGSLNSLTCSNPETSSTTGLTIGQTYYIRAHTYSSGTSSVFNICLKTPPSNDNCLDAQTLNANISIQGNTTEGTSSGVPQPICATLSDADDDVWYKVTANVADLLNISVTGSINFDAVVVLYSGTCGTLTEVDCADDSTDGEEEMITYPVVVAGDYYVRVYDYYTGFGTAIFDIVASGPALPITISKISAHNNGKNNMITWTTSSEVNNDVQMLERSKDGISGWEIVEKVNGTNSRENVTYDVYDNNPYNTSFYRVHSVDFDGKVQFSKIVSVQREGRSGVITSIQPNPTANFVEIDLQPEFDGDITYTIFDVTGKLLKTAVFTAINDALNTHILDMSDLQTGLYFVTIQGGGINQNAKIFKQ